MTTNTASATKEQFLVTWSDELSVGIQEIDEQHKVLVDLLNELYNAIVDHHGSEVSHEILGRLLEYTRVHFAVEESLMRILGYPEYEDHKYHHELLLKEVHMLGDKVASGKKSIGFELLHFLKIWLTRHIMEEDKMYGPFFVSKGVKTTYQKRSLMGKFWDSLHK